MGSRKGFPEEGRLDESLQHGKGISWRRGQRAFQAERATHAKPQRCGLRPQPRRFRGVWESRRMKRTALESDRPMLKSPLCPLQPITPSEPPFFIWKRGNSSLEHQLHESRYPVSLVFFPTSQSLEQCQAQVNPWSGFAEWMVGWRTVCAKCLLLNQDVLEAQGSYSSGGSIDEKAMVRTLDVRNQGFFCEQWEQ